MGALRGVGVESFAVVTAYTLSHDDFRSANSAPLARFFAELARAAFRPALDPEHGEFGKQAKRCPNWTEKTTVKVPDKHCSDQQDCETGPHGS